MKNILNKWVMAVFAVIIFAGCSGTAHIEKDKSVDFSKCHTYAWVDKTEVDGVKKKPKHDLTETNIRNAVDEQLQKKGWKKVNAQPDILVNYDLLVEKNEKQQQDPVYAPSYTRTLYNRYTGRFVTFFYPSQFVGYDYYSTTVKEGTITISMVDNLTDKMVWQGWTTSELNSGNISSREIDRNVIAIFRKFDTGG